jgi:hypothetical protein
MFKAKIINKIEFPKITMTEDIETIAREIIIPDIQQGIYNGKAINGGMLPKNEDSTIAKKNHATSKRLFTLKGGLRERASKQIEKTGLMGFGSARPLIETGKLVSSIDYRTRKNGVVIYIRGDRAEIGAYLQKGIKAGGRVKQYRFFGISKNAFNRMNAYWKQRIKELVSNGK